MNTLNPLDWTQGENIYILKGRYEYLHRVTNLLCPLITIVCLRFEDYYLDNYYREDVNGPQAQDILVHYEILPRP